MASHCTIILLGDFNIHMEITDNIHAIEFLDLLSSFDMFNSVHERTRSHGRQLDLIITRSDFIASYVNVSLVGWSDHCLVTY